MSAQELGDAVIEAFRRNQPCIDDIEMPEHKRSLNAVARQCGFGSWNRLESGSTFCDVCQQGDTVLIQAMARRAKGRGYSRLEDDPRVECEADALVIGEALLTIKPLLR